MQYSTICVLLLAISEPLLVHAKVVVVVPRHVRRTPGMMWKSSPAHFKKPIGNNDLHRHVYYSYGNRYQNRKPYRPLQYPPGGNDFDQVHETLNHAQVPYGKDVNHAISFGKGYIPYENVKSSSLPFVHERYAGSYTRQPAAVPDYPPTGFTSVGQEYAASANAHTYESPHVDSFFSDMEGAARSELHDTLKDTANKYYTARSIEKDFNLRNQQALSNAVERDSLVKSNELAKDASSATYGHVAAANTANVGAGMQGAIVLPAGIPPATIAGNKDGIVLRDTVSLDEYHKKLDELTKTWPNVLSSGAGLNGYPGGHHQPVHVVDRFPPTNLPFGGYGLPGNGWVSNFAQSKQGYSVQEDYVEPASHDFRTMPVHAGPHHQLPPLAMNVGVPGGIMSHHG